MPRNHHILSLLIAALAAPAAAQGASAAATGQTPLQQCLANRVSADSFSGVISIRRGADIITVANGMMAGSDSPAINRDAIFNLGSAGKMFTAVAVAQLVDSKKVQLDDSIGRYVDGLTAEASLVTVRQLLTHSSGLGNFFTPDALSAIQRARSLSDLKPLVLDDKPAFPPGSKFRYSNSGYLLLGLLVERVSGKPFDQYVGDHIFLPAAMTSTSPAPPDPSRRAIGMTTMPDFADMPPPPRGPLPPGGAGGPMPAGPPPMPPAGPLRPATEAALLGNSAGAGYSNAADMQRFFAALHAGNLTSIAMRDLLTSPQATMATGAGGTPTMSYGMGFGTGVRQGRRWLGHNGGTLGVNVETMSFPDDQVTIIIMANRDPPMAAAMLRKLLPVVLDGATCEREAATNPAPMGHG